MNVNSIQRGTLLIGSPGTSATATVSSVDTTKSELSLLGGSGVMTSTPEMLYPRITLTNSTTITATIFSSCDANITLSWELLEYQ